MRIAHNLLPAWLLITAGWLSPAAFPAEPAPTGLCGSAVDESVAQESRGAIRRGLQFLLKEQLPDGSWARHPALTGLAALALLNAPEGLATPESAAAAERAARWLRRALAEPAAAPDAAGERRSGQAPYPTLNLAAGSWAVIRLQLGEDGEFLRGVRRRLFAAQCLDVPESDPAYGGFRPAPDSPPDLTTTAYVLETLYLTDGLEARRPAAATAYAAALRFVARGLPAADTFETPAAAPEGGKPPRDGLRAAAELKSLLYAGAKAGDPRVSAVLGWFGREGSLAANPGSGEAGYYAYTFTMAQAFRACERRGVEASAPGTRMADWRRRLLNELLRRQSGDGGWTHASANWWETRPELTTACALLAMELALLP